MKDLNTKSQMWGPENAGPQKQDRKTEKKFPTTIASVSVISGNFWSIIYRGRGATTSSKLEVQFLGLWYYYFSTEKIRQIYPVWCSRLHNHTVFIKKLRKNLGVRPNFGGPDPQLPVVAPMSRGNSVIVNNACMCDIFIHACSKC